ncbi:hypothetical protein TNCV_1176941 [Trichonephila clavipes]|nr:hypothetical protein TNCV_1176941 [Trichonephila clavipes]
MHVEFVVAQSCFHWRGMVVVWRVGYQLRYHPRPLTVVLNYEVIMSGGPTRDRDRESSGETLVYELASESNESVIQSSDTVLPATSGESAMIQMSKPNKELESETMCDSENQVQGVHLRESFIDLHPGKWVFPVNDSQRHDLIQNRPPIKI